MSLIVIAIVYVSIIHVSLPLDGFSVALASISESRNKQVNNQDSDLKIEPVREIIFEAGSKDNTIHFKEYERFPRCMSGRDTLLCAAYGPANIEIEYDGELSSYELGEDMYAVCYLGRASSFCDIYQAVPTKN